MSKRKPAWLASRSFRLLAWTLAALLFQWAAAWALVPPLLKHQAEKRLAQTLGRGVTIGRIDFKPWTLELTVEDIRIAATGSPGSGKAPQLQVRRIYLDAELQSLLRLAPVVDAVQVDGLQMQVAHLGEGRYDFDDIVARMRAASAEPSDDPLRFAIYNLALNEASLTFEDRPVQRTHELRELRLAVPFLSNLPSQREVKVQPRLAFRLNGSAFDSSAEGTPFAQSRKSELTLNLKAMNLEPYLVYWPATMPVKLLAAVLDAELRLSFEQSASVALGLTGWAQASGVKLADYQARDLLAFESMRIDLGTVRPLERDIALKSIEWVAPQVVLRRDRSGAMDLLPVSPPKSDGVAADASAPPSQPWKLRVDSVALRSGTVSWLDESTQPGAQLAIHDLTLDVKEVAWPFLPATEGGKSPLFEGSATMRAGNSGTRPAPEKSSGRLTWRGQGTDTDVKVSVHAEAVDLGLAAPYVAQFLVPRLGGRLDADADLAWSPGGRQVFMSRLAVHELALGADKSRLASLAKLEASGATIDLARRSIEVGRLILDRPKALVVRDKEGHWMYEGWVRLPAQVATESAAAVKSGVAKAVPEGGNWTLSLADVAMADGVLGFRDELGARPVAVELSALKLQLRNFVPLANATANKGGAAKPPKPTDLSFSAQVAAGSTEPGRITYRGSLTLAPLSTKGSIEATRLPVHAFEPYWRDRVNIELLRADASFKGDIDYADVSPAGGPAAARFKLTGDTALEEVRAMMVPVADPAGAVQVQVQGAEELLTWKLLSLRGLDVAMMPAVPLRVDVAETVLSDFYARVIIDSQGRINLQDLVKSADAPALPASAVAGSASGAVLAPAPAASATVASVAERPNISFGPISLVSGRVQFSDRFIRPNYSAALSELTGRLSAFSSASAQTADLDLRGRAEGTASLEITGKLNPLAQPLALDIKAKVRDLELSPMSPYAIKYAGHGIQRGKLSVDVAYLVKPDGELTASNNLVLNQLTFGDKVEGAPNSLPVKLAVALLSDRNGVIDINLPISGSLNDPQFKLGPIIFKVIVNLIVKAITSPFSLLASAFGGGGDELGMVGFEPGSVALSDKSRQGLDKVAKALSDRPALKMTVQGAASLELEREAFRRERLQVMVLAEKRRQMVLSGAALPAQGEAPLQVAASEYPELLTQVYRRSELPKPQDADGKPKVLPLSEMEALLASYIKVDDESMRELAQRRGVVVRDYLAEKALPPDRLFLGEVKLMGADASWTPRADLMLATP